jgi:predicted nucleic acid-binding protein
MTLVVSDNSPFNLLIRLDLAVLLPQLFGEVLIPPEVVAEMLHAKAPAVVQAFIATPPPWLSIRATTRPLPLPHLDSGEAAAISLATELSVPLLIDELDGRTEAQTRGLVVIGAIGILERAANLGLIPDLSAVHQQIRTMRFHISDAVLTSSLNRHLATRQIG